MKLQDMLPKVVPTTIEGVYIQDLSFEAFKAFEKELNAEEDKGKAALLMFERIICDAEGERFEDVNGVADLEKMGMSNFRGILAAAWRALVPPIDDPKP